MNSRRCNRRTLSMTTEDTNPQSSADQDNPWDELVPPETQSKGNSHDLDLIMDIPVKLSVELGRTRITIKQLLELAQGSVVELDGLAGEPMDILINGYLIAQGEVVVLDDKYGIRITEIVTPSERVQKLNR
ncbi:flagellar motor switch protein FliN [Pseudidiomarina insulisalsae]|uniref:Flagellar motor switch protein FliN n=2 Tax=Pseudidiomarina insulisalsae TaxID=575789 RepID=A0A432YDJ1_9GAMM|nr:flagellar motor switch protein FliN [Pseudidiomarina insulisalsae]